jgi:hypothetical protein
MKQENKENNTVDIITDETTESERSKKVMNKDNINKLSHLPFEEYFGNDWRKHFQEQETVQSILDAAGLSDSHDFVQVNSRYLINDNRVAVIALVRRKNSKLLEKLIIDVIACNSSFDQFFDVVYNIGSDCDYRMILCDWNSKNEEPGLRMTDNIMRQLINLFEHHLFLYWISADAIRDVDGTMKVIYTVIESVAKSHRSSDMPDRRDLEFAELYCYAMASSMYGQFLQEDAISFNSRWEEDGAETEWTDEGLITIIEMDQDDYTWLFTMRTANIKDDDCSYEYDEETGILTITEDLPFQNFINSLPETKSNLANNYYHRARIGSWIDELLGEKEDEPPSADDDAKNKILVEAFGPDWNKKRSHKFEFEPEPEPIHLPSVLEFLGPDWKEYFHKPETIKEIVLEVSHQNEMQAYLRKRLRRETGVPDDGMAYDFVEINSITHLGDNRVRIIALFRDNKNGSLEKWSLDITSTTPLLDQYFYALYDSEDECARKIILYFEKQNDSDESDTEVKIEEDTLISFFFCMGSFENDTYPIQVKTEYDEENIVKISFFDYPRLNSNGQGKILSRSIFESNIWDSYYSRFMYSPVIKEKYQSDLITDNYMPYAKIPFFVWPEWTEKGLLMRLNAYKDCPETNWLITGKKAELARHYPGRQMEVKMIPGMHYCIEIQLHDAPVADFIESSTKAKFSYASEIHEQQLDLIRHIEEIFQDYALEAE